jgi:hypothetical protein
LEKGAGGPQVTVFALKDAVLIKQSSQFPEVAEDGLTDGESAHVLRLVAGRRSAFCVA